jgi:hypothetical protein
MPGKLLKVIWGRGAAMTTMRTHFTFRVDNWTPDGEAAGHPGGA